MILHRPSTTFDNCSFDGVGGLWKMDRGTLWVSTPHMQYEGALDPDAAYLRGSEADAAERIELELRFRPDASD